jgi:hypothetical protein
VLRQLNAVRRRFHKAPLVVEGAATEVSGPPPAPPHTPRTDSSPAGRGS